ncbi:bifunctional 3-phosphoshikimate 1-carboxyvinyltransferase/cytidylate kinase [Ramlibacter sp. AN1015]|uniref:bifunctional 3-phosphoshikimate 1-carboxyvinyltransferase/cytidylate kinase n=1 Tax=Ramlibacter sp. AN1015 TaxID=3133428 RepID=UPI0030BFDCC8
MFSTEFLDLPPLDGARGVVALPGSKSISNRVLLLAALSAGTTAIHDLLDSDDTRVMLAALEQLGCTLRRDGAVLEVTGLGGQAPAGPARLLLGNAGTAMRPLCAALAVLGGNFELSGVERMHERPIGDLVDALRALGCTIDYLGKPGYPPLRIGRPQLRLERPIAVRGDVSSQFLTALLMALPLVATHDVVIEVEGELVSKPYIEITLQLLGRFGVQVRRDGWRRFTIPSGSRLASPGVVHVERDASSASYFVALGALAARGTDVIRIEGLGRDSIQGDIRFLEAAERMGAHVHSGAHWIEVRRGAWPLRALDMDCNHIPDAAMTLAVMALYADGPSTLRNIASWRVKETDRLAAVAAELRKLGAEVEEGADFLRITPPVLWQPARIRTYDDHRIAMCFSLAAFNPRALPVRIDDPKCVAKTFPDYFETLFRVVSAAPHRVPVICIDGPTASGKGTLASRVAQRLGFHYLDSGALYRITALAALRSGLALDVSNEAAIAELAARLPVHFAGDRVLLDSTDVSDAIRTEQAGMNASQVSALPAVRIALLALQQEFRALPGLVADGRDMGTVVFPNAPLKVYLTASAGQRAERRHRQLSDKGIATTIDGLRADLEARDARDSQRAVSPLKPAQDALLLDNSEQSIEQSVAQVLQWWEDKQPFGSA